jgi:hypothetical protein
MGEHVETITSTAEMTIPEVVDATTPVVEEEEDKDPKTVYVKEDVDYGDWVDDFLAHEENYYDYIHSFAEGGSTLLRIVDADGQRLSSAVLLHNEDSPVLEVKRADNEDFERQEHDSIEDWYLSVVGLHDTYNTEMFDRVLISDQRVPLWRVLEVSQEEDEAGTDGDDETDDHAKVKAIHEAAEEEFHELMFLVAIMILFFMLFVSLAYAIATGPV